jgi:hypothetical protein
MDEVGKEDENLRRQFSGPVNNETKYWIEICKKEA